jgi:putative hemolysin
VKVALDVAVVLALVLIEGLFVGVEISLVSLRDSQVKGMASRGRRGAAVAHLVGNPNRFLAGVQIGVTLCALLSSAYGAVTLSDSAASGLADLGLSDRASHVIGFLAVTLTISFVTLVVGELVPKRLALQRAEKVAQLAAPSLDRFASLMRPFIWLLSMSTDVLVRLAGGDPDATREAISEEELRGLLASHQSLGRDERRLINEVFVAGDRKLREVLVPRTEVEFLDASITVAQALATVASGPHSRYPVVRGSHDDVVGFVHIRDLVSARAEADPRSVRIGDLVRPVKMLPDGKNVLAALSEMRRERQHLAMVIDEYGGTAGIVTLEDLVEYDAEGGGPHHLRGGDVVVDGLLNTDDFAEQAGVELPEGPYETVAGFLMAELGHLPQLGETVEVDGYRLTVTELDGRRVARVRVSAPPGALQPEGSARVVQPDGPARLGD